MKRKRPSRRELLASTSEIGPEDGSDPVEFFKKKTQRETSRKALQLCSEVARTVQHMLSWELGDEMLSLVRVESVAPAPSTVRLRVFVSVPIQVDVSEATRRLQRVTGPLRTAIAHAVARRRVPELSFRIAVRADPT